MPKVYSLEQPPKKEKQALQKELEEYPELKPRLTFVWPISKQRQKVLEMIESGEVDQKEVERLIQSNDFIEQQAGLYLFNPLEFSNKDRRKVGNVLEKIIHGKDIDRRCQSAAHDAKNNLRITINGEKKLLILKNKIQKKDPFIRLSAVRKLGDIGEGMGKKILPILEKMSQDENPAVREEVVRASEKIAVAIQNKEKIFSLLKKMTTDQDWHVKVAAIEGLANIGEGKVLPFLEKLIQETGPNKDQRVEIVVLNSIARVKSEMSRVEEYKKWLLSTRKPLFTTPHTKELIRRILKLEKISQELKSKFRNSFIGLTIFGSMAKGYLGRKSDLDFAVIAQNKPEVFDYFERLLKTADLPSGLAEGGDKKYINIDKNYTLSSRKSYVAAPLFYGLFFGDRQKLLKLQKNIFKDIDEKQWDKIRREIEYNEIALGKTVMKFGITDKELEKIRQYVSLLRVPPPYQEALKLVRSRAK